MRSTTAVVLSIIIVALVVIRPLFLKSIPVQNLESASQEPVVPAPSLHPLSIDNLRATTFPSQSITVESEVTANTKVVSYYSENLKLNALMIHPKGDPPPGGWPVVIVNHGYIPPSQYRTRTSYINTSNFFANRGFLVLKPDYRGHDQSAGDSARHLFLRSQYVVDVLNLLASIASIPTANPEKIYMYGHSMGGDITLQVLEITTKVKAATLWAPATTAYPEHYLHFLNKLKPSPALTQQFHQDYQTFLQTHPISQISSYENLDKISTPLNLHHGTKDESVPYSWGEDLSSKLKALGKEINFYPYQGDNHDIAGNFTKALTRDVDFFTLQSGKLVSR